MNNPTLYHLRVCVCVFTVVLIKTDCISLLLYITFAHNVNLFVAISLDDCQVQCGIAGQTRLFFFFGFFFLVFFSSSKRSSNFGQME